MNNLLSHYFMDYFENLSEPLIIINTEFDIQYLNKSFMNVFQINSSTELTLKNFYKMIFNEDFEKLTHTINSIKINKKSKEIKLRLCYGMKIQYCNLTIEPIEDQVNKLTAYFIRVKIINNSFQKLDSIHNIKGNHYFESFISIINKSMNTNYIELGLLREEQKICNTLVVLVKNDIISNFSYSIKNLIPLINSEYYLLDIQEHFKHHILYSIDEIKKILIYPILNIYGEILAIISLDITNNSQLINEFIEIMNYSKENLLKRIEYYNFEKEIEKLSNKLEIKKKEFEQIIYITSHDLRSPLVNIQGFSSELNNGITKLIRKIETESNLTNELDEIIREDIDDSLKYINTSIEKMDNLLNGLLKLSRLVRTRLNYEMLEINLLFNKVISTFPNDLIEKITINLKDLPKSFADKITIEEVIEHLISNAIRYLREDRQGFISIWGKNLDDENLYCIEDNGIGIDKSKYDKIFEMFYKIDPNKSNGIGIGLTIAKKMLERNNGKIWVESSEENTKFYFTLPAKELKNE